MPTISIGGLKFFSREPKIRVLNFTWVAFFISFLVWFNHAPLLAAIRTTFDLNDQQISGLLILNVALTIPARIFVGMLVDKFGPRLMFSGLLVLAGILCIWFALAESYTTLAVCRFLLGFVGAGFVVGIRMISEWFPAKETGIAQGIYAGFGNFGSAAAAVTLPTLSLALGGAAGWRWSIALTGLIAIIYGVIYYYAVSDTPKGSTYFRPKKIGAMEVTSRSDFFLYAVTQAPLFLALAVLAWKLGPSGLRLLSAGVTYITYVVLAGIYSQQIFDTWRINKGIFDAPVAEIHRYKFRQVAVLNLAYFITFGSELAVVSILPLFFKDAFDLSLTTAGLLGASFGITTFFARPTGGWLSDRFGRRNVLLWCLCGTAAGYVAMSFMSLHLGLVFAVIATFICSLFVNAGNGAVYAMLPMIKRRLTGQIAGMVGAYGNVGGVLFLTVYSLVSTQWFFLTLAASALIGLVIALFFIEEPKGQIAETMPDGSVTMIDVT